MSTMTTFPPATFTVVAADVSAVRDALAASTHHGPVDIASWWSPQATDLLKQHVDPDGSWTFTYAPTPCEPGQGGRDRAGESLASAFDTAAAGLDSYGRSRLLRLAAQARAAWPTTACGRMAVTPADLQSIGAVLGVLNALPVDTLSRGIAHMWLLLASDLETLLDDEQ